MIVQAGLYGAHMLAEAQHDAEFFGLDAEEAGQAPDRQRADQDQRDAHAAEMSAWQQLLQPVLAAAQKILKIRRPRPDRLRTRAPWPFRTRAPGAPALILPRHRTILLGRPAIFRPRPHMSARLYRGPLRPLQRKLPVERAMPEAVFVNANIVSAVNAIAADDMSHRKSRRYRPDRRDFARAPPLPSPPDQWRETTCRPRLWHGLR